MNTLGKRLMTMALAGLLAGCAGTGGMGTGGRQLVLSDDGHTEMAVVGAWETRPDISRKAQIRLVNNADDMYLLVNSYLPGEIKKSTLEEFAKNLSGAIFENLGQGRVSEARAIKVGNLPAIEYEMRTGTKDDGVTYLSTVVQGQRARYHMLGWTSADGDVSALRHTLGALRESATVRPVLERVALTFHWPDRLKSHSNVHLKVNKRNEQYEMQGEVEGTVRRVSGEELLVSTKVLRHKFTFGAASRKDKAKDEFLQSVMRASLTEIPDYVVNDDGELVRIENLAAYHRRLQDVVVKGLPSANREAHARAREFVKSALTEDTLLTAFKKDWAEYVGNWAGGAYVVGHAYVYTNSYSAPQISEEPFAMEVTQQLAGYVPCKAGAAPRSCVRLLQTSRVKGRDYTRAMDAYVRKTVGNGVRVEDMEVVNTVELITDPRTLLPHATHTKETKRVTINAEGKSVVTEDVEEEKTSYRY